MRGYVKRYAADSNGNLRNYFNLIHSDFDDGLFFDKILNGTFTNYNEEITSRENEFDIVFGDFSIAFSLNDSIRSENGLSVKEFFKPSDNTLYKYAISLNLGAKEIGGIMDNESTTVDKSFLSGKWDITLSFFSWEKEFAAFCLTSPQVTGPVNIDDFIREKLFFGPDNGITNLPRLEFDLNFNWETKVGFTPILVWEAYNQMLINGISENGWQLFKELAFGLGFVFKLRTDGLVDLDHNFIKVVLWCGWRSQGINHREIRMIEPHTETNQISAETFLMLLYRQDIATNQINDAYRFSGIMKNKEGLYINDGQNETPIRRNFYTIDAPDFQSEGVTISCKNQVRNLEDPVPPFPYDKTLVKNVKMIHRIYYFINKPDNAANKYYFINSWSFQEEVYQTSTIAFCRLFVKNYTLHDLSGGIGPHRWEIQDSGWFDQNPNNSLIQKTAGNEYDFLLKGNKNIINTEIHFDNNTELEIYDTAIINRRNYWLRRLISIDLLIEEGGQKASTEWVEI